MREQLRTEFIPRANQEVRVKKRVPMEREGLSREFLPVVLGQSDTFSCAVR